MRMENGAQRNAEEFCNAPFIFMIRRDSLFTSTVEYATIILQSFEDGRRTR